MKKNVIPRKATKLFTTALTSGGGFSAGDKIVIEKIDNEWIGADKTGKMWSFFVSHLRNGELFRIDAVE